MITLSIAKNLSLPVDIVTQVEVILAKRRAGKSYTMRRVAEQLLKAAQQVVMVDPKGDQWGIRSSSDGKKPGYPVLILGGEHGDLPLEVNGGELVARLVVEERVSILLDLSQFRKHEIATFMTAFLENLYRLKAQEKYRTPMKLIVDEADAVAPQKPQKGEERMLGAIEDIVRRGGQRGIGCTLVTQRSAVLNKNVLTQAQMLVVLRTIAPQDLAAMKAWIDVHGTVEQAKELMDSLPSLPIGDAWFWSPGWPTEEGIFKRVHVLPIETFDSGATPKPGQRQVIPKNLADVDLDALKGQMAATIESAKANDPKALRSEVARLTRELAAQKPAPASIAPMGVSQWRELGKKLGYWDYFEKQINQAAGKEWELLVKQWAAYAKRLRGVLASIGIALAGTDKVGIEPFAAPVGWFSPSNLEAASRLDPKKQVAGFNLEAMAHGVVPTTDMRPPQAEYPALNPEVEMSTLKAGARKMLEVAVARSPMRMTKSQYATLCGMSHKSSTFDQYLAALKRAGFITTVDGLYTATQDGIEACGSAKPTPQTPEEIREMWRKNLKAGAAKLLDVLIGRGRIPISREELALEGGMSMTSSTFDQYVAVLKRNGLAQQSEAGIIASEMFYE